MARPSRKATDAVPAAMPQRPGSPYLLILGTPTIVWIVLSGALHNFNMYALNGFVPALIGRYYGLTDRNAGLVAGIILGAVGIVGLLGGGWVADRVQRLRGVTVDCLSLRRRCWSRRRASTSASRSRRVTFRCFMVWVGLGVMLMYVYYAGVYAAIQDVVEPSLRGTAMALYFFVMYVLGGAFGTYVLGWLSDTLAVRAMSAAGQSLVANRVPEQFRAIGLHQAMYIAPLLCFGLAVVLFAASRTVTGDMQKLADWYEETPAGRLRESEVAMPVSAGSEVPLPEAT